MTGCRYFDSVDICKYRSDWMESRQKITLPSSIVVKPLVTRVEVFEATEVDIGLFQEGARSLQSVFRINTCHSKVQKQMMTLFCLSKFYV